MSYTRLSLLEREQILAGLAAGDSLRQIASAIARAPSTVSREIRRNTAASKRPRWAYGTRPKQSPGNRPTPGTSSAFGYSAVYAHRSAQLRARAHTPGRKIDRYPWLRWVIYRRLATRWSPQQIAKELKRIFAETPSMRISHETIYAYLYVRGRAQLNKRLISYLRQHRTRRRSSDQATDRRGQIPEMLWIEERPAEVADRTIPGHWEGDLIIGKNHHSALGVLVERVTRLVILVPLSSSTAASVRQAFAEEIKQLPAQLAISLTYDQGREMLEHRQLSAETNITVYFAHPHSPWERGTCENTNMLIRGFFPKGTDFKSVSPEDIKWVQRLLNQRPRQTLNWRTPAQVFAELHTLVTADPQPVALAP